LPGFSELGYNILVSLAASHFDPSAYPDPERFDPLRFIDQAPDTSTWLPFGGGVRRCIGAAFANMEMKVVLRTILRHYNLIPTSAADERVAFRGVAYAPGKGGKVRVQNRPSS
jgi:cytochrome P450 family 138